MTGSKISVLLYLFFADSISFPWQIPSFATGFSYTSKAKICTKESTDIYPLQLWHPFPVCSFFCINAHFGKRRNICGVILNFSSERPTWDGPCTNNSHRIWLLFFSPHFCEQFNIVLCMRCLEYGPSSMGYMLWIALGWGSTSSFKKKIKIKKSRVWISSPSFFHVCLFL